VAAVHAESFRCENSHALSPQNLRLTPRRLASLGPSPHFIPQFHEAQLNKATVEAHVATAAGNCEEGMKGRAAASAAICGGAACDASERKAGVDQGSGASCGGIERAAPLRHPPPARPRVQPAWPPHFSV
jgi:hypothetical protein